LKDLHAPPTVGECEPIQATRLLALTHRRATGAHGDERGTGGIIKEGIDFIGAQRLGDEGSGFIQGGLDSRGLERLLALQGS
jgi:hypothetical protein